MMHGCPSCGRPCLCGSIRCQCPNTPEPDGCLGPPVVAEETDFAQDPSRGWRMDDDDEPRAQLTKED